MIIDHVRVVFGEHVNLATLLKCTRKRNPFSQCPFWRPIVAAALPELASLDLDQMVAVRESLTPKRAAVASLRGLEARDLPGVSTYLEHVVALLRSVRAATGSRVIVDSSKAPGHGFLLRSSPDVDAYVLHLVLTQDIDPDKVTELKVGAGGFIHISGRGITSRQIDFEKGAVGVRERIRKVAFEYPLLAPAVPPFLAQLLEDADDQLHKGKDDQD